jgi:hypothetical protein
MNCAGADDSIFKITAKGTNDSIEVGIENDLAIFAIRSPKGIGEARIERTKSQWPKKAMLRLHLKGLESLVIGDGKVKLNASVSSHGSAAKIRQWMEAQEESPLDAESPFWMDLRMYRNDGTSSQAILPNDGYFEVRLPKALFDENPDFIVVSWIDFYR